jgi:hypothetical protein
VVQFTGGIQVSRMRTLSRHVPKQRFGNKKQELDGHSFASKLEASVYQTLKLRMKAGEIISIQCQDHIYLTDARIGYIPDFKCQDSSGEFFWVEAKGYPNDVWPIKKKLWKSYGPGKLEIWTGSHLNPQLTEIIIPKKEIIFDV